MSPVCQGPIEAAIMPTNAVLVVFIEGFHECPVTSARQATASCRTRSLVPRAQGMSKPKPLAGWPFAPGAGQVTAVRRQARKLVGWSRLNQRANDAMHPYGLIPRRAKAAWPGLHGQGCMAR